jgi:GNAT superfamily N-acetyltransferase
VFTLRRAIRGDVPQLRELIPLSVRALSAPWYSREQIEAALEEVFGVDTQLIEDGTYLVAEADGLVGAGGWSRRATLFGGDQRKGGVSDARLDPATDAARIRAFYVRPDWARRGVGRAILARCEEEAHAAGFRRAELLATLPGVALYSAMGYEAIGPLEAAMRDGLSLPGVRMGKRI